MLPETLEHFSPAFEGGIGYETGCGKNNFPILKAWLEIHQVREFLACLERHIGRSREGACLLQVNKIVLERSWKELSEYSLEWGYHEAQEPSKNLIGGCLFDLKTWAWDLGNRFLDLTVPRMRPKYSRSSEGQWADFWKLITQLKVWSIWTVLWTFADSLRGNGSLSRRSTCYLNTLNS